MEIKLKPCPFCGSVAEIITVHDEDGDKYYAAECQSCYVQTDGYIRADLAAKAWNRRADNEDIDSIPAVDAVEVVHGEWRPLMMPGNPDVRDTDEWYGELFACNQCNGTMIGESNFCPDCGARMDGKRREEGHNAPD